jgi:hypothetical protein
MVISSILSLDIVAVLNPTRLKKLIHTIAYKDAGFTQKYHIA